MTAFLEAPTEGEGDQDPSGTIETVEVQLQQVLGGVVDRIGIEKALAVSGIGPEQAAQLVAVATGERSAPVANLTLSEAAALLAAEMAFRKQEVRGRIRDHLVIAMSRGPRDVTSLSRAYGFDDSAVLQAKVEGDRTLTLREYARLRVALGVSERNHNP